MRATSSLQFERYGALINLLYDKRQVFLFVEHISVSERNATPLHYNFIPPQVLISATKGPPSQKGGKQSTSWHFKLKST